jgi:undecaprenyl-phosphate 4-deoxy-4-formamido-L-arabinose transferase
MTPASASTGANALSIVVPVYNSAASLPNLAAELGELLPRLSDRFELILVNDGSRDSSWNVIAELASRYGWVRGVDLLRNYGQHNALLCGIRLARYDTIVTLDDDLQHPPSEIPKLLSKLAEGFDVVYGAPERQQHGLWRDLASQFTKFSLRSAMGVQNAGEVTAFRAFRTHTRIAFADYQGMHVSIDVLLTWGTTRFTSIRVRHAPRQVGVSNYTFRKLVTHALNMLTGFSTLPLQFASLIGFVFTTFGFLVFIYVIGRYLIQGGSVPGFPFLASIIAIFSGAQMFSLGIIGEYLARMYFHTLGRPSYGVRADLDNDNPRGSDTQHP